MTLQNTQKLVGAIVIVACITFLMGIGKVDSAAGLPVITAIAGYILGNGIGAKQGITSEPVIAPSPNKES